MLIAPLAALQRQRRWRQHNAACSEASDHTFNLDVQRSGWTHSQRPHIGAASHRRAQLAGSSRRVLVLGGLASERADRSARQQVRLAWSAAARSARGGLGPHGLPARLLESARDRRYEKLAIDGAAPSHAAHNNPAPSGKEAREAYDIHSKSHGFGIGPSRRRLGSCDGKRPGFGGTTPHSDTTWLLLPKIR